MKNKRAYGTKKRKSKAQLLLDEIERTGGMRYREMQMFVWQLSWCPRISPFTRAQRGYWCAALQRILPEFTIRGDDGVYRRDDTPSEGQPWKVIRRNQRLRGWGHRYGWLP